MHEVEKNYKWKRKPHDISFLNLIDDNAWHRA